MFSWTCVVVSYHPVFTVPLRYYMCRHIPSTESPGRGDVRILAVLVNSLGFPELLLHATLTPACVHSWGCPHTHTTLRSQLGMSTHSHDPVFTVGDVHTFTRPCVQDVHTLTRPCGHSWGCPHTHTIQCSQLGMSTHSHDPVFRMSTHSHDPVFTVGDVHTLTRSCVQDVHTLTRPCVHSWGCLHTHTTLCSELGLWEYS